MLPNKDLTRSPLIAIAVALLILVALGRIVLTYRVTSVAWDEPCHIAAGIEWVDKGTYTLDPIHPPLSRLAIGLPLYLAGVRIPVFPDQDLLHHDYYEVGTRILYDGGHYYRNLVLARLGVLPFFIVTTVLVFWWTRCIFGDLAALAAVVLFTTTPSILAFAGLAYTDTTTTCTQFGALFALAAWIQKPGRTRTAVLGLALGLALLSKMTTLLYLPACAAGILLTKWWVAKQSSSVSEKDAHIGKLRWLTELGVVVAIAVVVLWGGYRFSVGHVREDMGLSVQSMPSFQHFPGPVGSLARKAIISDWLIPAPALIRGFSVAWVVNQTRLPSYMLGTTTNGGLWYFFFVALAVKAPLPLLVLAGIGVCSLVSTIRQKKDWMRLVPAIAVFIVLVTAISVQYKEGVRHILVVFPLLAVVAGYGAAVLWKATGGWRVFGRAVMVGLLLWQCVSSVRAGRDFISYYNILAGSDPSKVYLTGCDLDCGQDIYRLAQEVHKLNIPALSIAVWSSSDIYRMGLPKLQLLKPYHPVTGWVAISVRSLRLGQTLHKVYPVNAFSWLEQYKPVQQVGKTISLYYIPPSNQPAAASGFEDAPRRHASPPDPVSRLTGTD